MPQAIFLSYASQDADAARRICEALRAAGLEVWFDQSELRGGDAWDASIRKQIKECSLFVPVISASTDARPEGYFRLEWKLAVDRSHLMADDQPFFVPVILGDIPERTARVPEKFRERQWTRLTDDAATTAFAERVAKLIGGSASSGKNASNAASNGEFDVSSAARDAVVPAQAGIQVSSSSRGQPKLDPRLRGKGLCGYKPRLNEPTFPREGGDPSLVVRRQMRTWIPAFAEKGKIFNLLRITNLDPRLRGDDSIGGVAKSEQVTPGQTSSSSARTRVIAALATLVAIACAATAWFVVDHNRKQTFIAQSLTNIESLARSTKYMEAYRLAIEVERAGGAALLTEEIRESYSRAIDVTSTPEGAAIAIRQYRPDASEQTWIDLGASPMTKVRVPRGVLEWRATLPQKPAHTMTAQTTDSRSLVFSLPASDTKGADMVPVPAGETSIGGIYGLIAAQNVKLNAFAIDRTEVTNRQFADFVKAGGYSREEFWKHPFLDGTKTPGFSEAMARFKDATGRAGPAAWRLGSFPDGEAELPVRGVSWHEASAYATFAGKALPTIYHWYYADSGNDTFTLIPALMPSANFEGKSPRAASTSRTISRFGAIDMAGNVREWVANATDKGRRVAVGGSWLEATYQYKYGSPYSAFDRPVDVGFRCVSKMANVESTGGGSAFSPLAEIVARDVKPVARVSDAEYAIYARMLGQGTAPLDGRIEATDTSKPHWTRIKVNYAVGYGNERMNAYLYLPKNAAPPFQTVIYYPGSGVFGIKKSYDDVGEKGGWQPVEILARGGRAVLYPVWKGSFERFDSSNRTVNYLRETLPHWASDLRQSVEFLRSRKEVDADRIGYFGYSQGAKFAPALLALEPRVSTAVLLAGGMDSAGLTAEVPPPELHMATYAPRVKIPVLMVNGRNDIRFPYETAQVPFFNLFGSEPARKKHKTYPGGHGVLGWYDDLAKETHDWFDEHFGPVKPVAQAASAK